MLGMLLDKPADGIPILQQALRESPTGGRAITWDTLGTACQQAGQWEQALSLYQQVLATCPPHARQTQIGAFMLGTCYQALGETAKAVGQFEKVIRDNNPLAGEARKALERLRSAGAQNKSG